ncbi:reverse transcriptase domain-containing protein [Tanacetum coccineum]
MEVTENSNLPVVQVQVPNSEPAVAPVSVPMPNLKPSIPYPLRRNDERRREKANDQIEKFYEIFKDLSCQNRNNLEDALIPYCQKFCLNILRLNQKQRKIKMEECLALAGLGASINLMPLSVWKKLSLPELTPICMTLELSDRSITKLIEILGFSDVIASGNPTPYYDPKGDILLLESFLNDDPSPPPTQGNYLPEIRIELKICEAKTDKSSIDEPLEVKLEDLPPHLEYVFLEGDNKLPVIIAKDLSVEEKAALIKVLKSHKRAIAWKLSDIKGINPEFYTHKILMEEDYKPAVQHQRRVNPKIHDVIKKEVEKLLDAGLIYPISVSPWVIFKFPSTLMIKKRQHSHVLTERSPTVACLLAYAMHRARSKGIEVDKAKIDVIAKLPYPTTVKGVRSFLGHASFYRRFIKDFSKISRPMTHLLKKNTPFIFSDDCIQASQTLKKKLTEAPILIAPDWDLPFELMCDASNFAIGAVLGQCHEKHFRPIHYASKTMNEADVTPRQGGNARRNEKGYHHNTMASIQRILYEINK